MRQKHLTGIISLFVVLSLYGCSLLVAGAVGGIGTAVWLSNKLVQEVNAPFERALAAAKGGILALKLKIDEETIKEDVAQIMSSYVDGQKIWIDIHKINAKTSRIEVRVGLTGDETAARKIMDTILKQL